MGKGMHFPIGYLSDFLTGNSYIIPGVTVIMLTAGYRCISDIRLVEVRK